MVYKRKCVLICPSIWSVMDRQLPRDVVIVICKKLDIDGRRALGMMPGKVHVPQRVADLLKKMPFKQHTTVGMAGKTHITACLVGPYSFNIAYLCATQKTVCVVFNNSFHMVHDYVHSSADHR